METRIVRQPKKAGHAFTALHAGNPGPSAMTAVGNEHPKHHIAAKIQADHLKIEQALQEQIKTCSDEATISFLKTMKDRHRLSSLMLHVYLLDE